MLPLWLEKARARLAGPRRLGFDYVMRDGFTNILAYYLQRGFGRVIGTEEGAGHEAVIVEQSSVRYYIPELDGSKRPDLLGMFTLERFWIDTQYGIPLK